MARRAIRIAFVSVQLHAQRGFRLTGGRWLDGIHIGRRRGRRFVEDHLQHPLPAMHGPMALAIRSQTQHPGLREQSAAMIFGSQSHALEGIALHARDAVVLGEPRVHHRPVRVEELAHAQILFENLAEKRGPFRDHTLLQMRIVIRVKFLVRCKHTDAL